MSGLKISTTTEAIKFYILGNLQICPGMVVLAFSTLSNTEPLDARIAAASILKGNKASSGTYVKLPQNRELNWFSG